MNLMRATITGEYPQIGEPGDADSYFAVSFGTDTTAETVNAEIKQRSYDAADSSWLIMERTLVDSYPHTTPEPDHIIEGPVSNLKGEGLGTYGVAIDGLRFMKTRGLYRPQIMAQAHHAPRVYAQLILAAEVLDMKVQPILLTNLPRKFDPESEQPWTRSKAKWTAFAPFIMMALKRRGQL
jgi:hypothetical protein